MEHSLKLGGTNYHFKWGKVPGTTPNTQYLPKKYIYIIVKFITQSTTVGTFPKSYRKIFHIVNSLVALGFIQ